MDEFKIFINLSQSKHALSFISYFEKEYIKLGKYFRWATFARLDARVNTNAGSESTFAAIESFCNHKNNLRMDVLLSKLSDYSDTFKAARSKREIKIDVVEMRSWRHIQTDNKLRESFIHFSNETGIFICEIIEDRVFCFRR